MRRNIFQFSDTYWRQKQGTAMGTPPACMWATLFFDPHEQHLTAKYQKYLLHWSRYIDDGFGVWDWTGTPECLQAFADFKQEINDTSLDWEVNSPSSRVNFLDLTLTICNGVVESTLFEKALSLHLYIPPSSAHPPGVLKGLVARSLLRIIRLTSNWTTRKNHISRFFRRLMAHGYTASHLQPIFDKYLQRFTATPATPAPSANEPSNDRVFLHLPYHPLDPKSCEVQTLF